MCNFINTDDLLPLEVSDIPWLYEINNEGVKYVDTGKWMLFYDKSLINEAWVISKKLYRENKLDGVISMKCSTAYENPRASTLDEGIIILYCNNSSNEETIINIGKKSATGASKSVGNAQSVKINSQKRRKALKTSGTTKRARTSRSS